MAIIGPSVRPLSVHKFTWNQLISFFFKLSMVFSKHFTSSRMVPKHPHIQNPGIFRTLACWEFEVYSELCQTSTMENFAKKIVNGYNWPFRTLACWEFEVDSELCQTSTMEHFAKKIVNGYNWPFRLSFCLSISLLGISSLVFFVNLAWCF